MNIGDVYLYKGKPVIITDGSYERNGRISNFWSFRYILPDGSLGEEDGDYNNEKGKFIKLADRVDYISKIKLLFT